MRLLFGFNNHYIFIELKQLVNWQKICIFVLQFLMCEDCCCVILIIQQTWYNWEFYKQLANEFILALAIYFHLPIFKCQHAVANQNALLHLTKQKEIPPLHHFWGEEHLTRVSQLWITALICLCFNSNLNLNKAL